MMLAVAPVEDLWKKNFRLSRAEFDEICNELRPYISPNMWCVARFGTICTI